jgi:hypothetical protein
VSKYSRGDRYIDGMGRRRDAYELEMRDRVRY